MASLALQHMLLQSWNGKPLAIFPSMPQAWKEARFQNMRAEGSVLVSAVRKNASTLWFSLNATKGGNLTVHTDIIDLTAGSGTHALQITSTASGVYDIVAPVAQPWAAVFFSQSAVGHRRSTILLCHRSQPARAISGARGSHRRHHHHRHHLQGRSHIVQSMGALAVEVVAGRTLTRRNQTHRGPS